MLPGALRERGEKLAEEFATSCLMGTGQFCTNPGLVLLVQGGAADAFVPSDRRAIPGGAGRHAVVASCRDFLAIQLADAPRGGRQVVAGDTPGGGQGYCHANTLLSVSGEQFLHEAEALQTEAFGNCSLLVIADDVEQLCQALDHLEGNLTGCVYTDTAGSDDAAYDRIAPHLRQRVGRLLNDKMPTGVAVSPAMNHGGPYPATGHPGFTAVGIPASLRRFAALQCYDNVRPHRLPPCLQDRSPNGTMWRWIDGGWTQADAGK